MQVFRSEAETFVMQWGQRSWSGGVDSSVYSLWAEIFGGVPFEAKKLLIPHARTLLGSLRFKYP